MDVRDGGRPYYRVSPQTTGCHAPALDGTSACAACAGWMSGNKDEVWNADWNTRRQKNPVSILLREKLIHWINLSFIISFIQFVWERNNLIDALILLILSTKHFLFSYVFVSIPALTVQRRIFPTQRMRAPTETAHKVGTWSLPLEADGEDGGVALWLSVPICVSTQLGHQITPTTISAYGTARLTRLTS